jgi:hypothetical protein
LQKLGARIHAGDVTDATAVAKAGECCEPGTTAAVVTMPCCEAPSAAAAIAAAAKAP